MSEGVVPTLWNCEFSFMKQATKFSFNNRDNCNIDEWILLRKAMLHTFFRMLYKITKAMLHTFFLFFF